MRAVLAQDCRNGPDDDGKITERRPRVNVVVVELHPVLERDIATSVDLPKACDALRHQEPPPRGRVVVFDLTWQRRARTYQGNVSEYDVNEIRELVNAGTAKLATEWMQSRILSDLKDGTIDFVEVHQLFAQLVRILDHRTQLEHLEAPAMLAHALLGENRRAASHQHDGDCGDRDQRCCRQKQQAADENVDSALERPPPQRHLALRDA